MDESTKHLLDATSIFTAVGTMLSWLPHLASLFTIVWLGIRIYETKTVQRLVKRKPKMPLVEPREPKASSNRVKKQMPTVSKKQKKFMQAVANNPKFAKKVGVNQSIGREFTKEKSMKTKKMMGGGMTDRMGRAMASGRLAGRPGMMADAAGRAMMKKGGKVKKMKKGGNTSRMNELEELGRVDAEKGYTKKGKRNLAAEKRRVVKEIKNKKAGGKIKGYKAGGMADKEGRALVKKTADARGRAMKAGGMKRQGANDRLDESLGMRRGKESTKSQSMKSRRDESRGMKAGGATMKAKGKKMAYGGKVKKMKMGGKVSSASKRADGIAQRGRTRGHMR